MKADESETKSEEERRESREAMLCLRQGVWTVAWYLLLQENLQGAGILTKVAVCGLSALLSLHLQDILRSLWRIPECKFSWLRCVMTPNAQAEARREKGVKNKKDATEPLPPAPG